MEIQFASSLEKIFSDQQTLPPPPDDLILFGGEEGNIQLCIKSETAQTFTIETQCALFTEAFETREVYSSLPIHPNAQRCTLLKNGNPGYYPDLLMPTEKILVKPGKYTSVWINLKSHDLKAGKYDLIITLTDEKNQSISVSHNIIISSARLSPQTLIHTNWFHADCLADYYGVDVFSGEHWRLIENFIENAASHGVNCILTPIFTPPLDTLEGSERPTVQLVDVYKNGENYTFGFEKLKKWVEISKKHGIEYFEFSHLFTQWGAKHAPKIIAQTDSGQEQIFGWSTDALSEEYRKFLIQLGLELKKATDALEITEKCFVHCSDEPGEKDLKQYESVSKIIKTAFPCYRRLDAVSHIEYYLNGLVETPVPVEASIEIFKKVIDNPWTYYCCGPYENELPNRFFAFPSIKNRILGVLLYKYNCEGFLHWGFNFYYSELSIRKINPFEETDAGGAFPSGDSFIVYPGDEGKPLSSLRQKVFYDALQDVQILRTAENVFGRAAVLSFIEKYLGNIDFSNYPLENERFFEFRKELYKYLESALF